MSSATTRSEVPQADEQAGPAAAQGAPRGGAALDAEVGDRLASAAAESEVSDEDVLEAMRDVVDPELGINVVDLGLVYGVTLDADGTAAIDMTLTSAACPLTDVIEDQTRSALVGSGVVPDYRITWVWMPPWGPDKITDDGREQLRALGFNV